MMHSTIYTRKFCSQKVSNALSSHENSVPKKTKKGTIYYGNETKRYKVHR